MSLTATPATTAPAQTPSAESPSRGFRPDIEGLRALALLAVLGFHAAVPGLAGGYVGVDVFFVISGYLITSLLLREALSTGRIRLSEFFARRARRLLPSAALVLVTVVVAGLWLVAPLRRSDLYHDVLAAALSVSNWRFVNEQTDYLAAGTDPGPLLHFWSLAVEEQFYLAWAPLVALLVLVAARRARAARLVLLAVTGLATAGSFLLCLRWSHSSVSLAYLGTPSRVWQFGVGALLALLPWRRLRGPGPLRALLGWAGAAAIGFACVGYDATTPYPGTAALLPTLGAAAVLLAGAADRDGDGSGPRYGVGQLLSLRAPRALGRLSYNLYLWHWPVLVLAEVRFGTLSWPVKAALTVASALPAAAAMRWVERPLRRSRVVSELPRRGLSLGVTAIVVPVVLALVAGAVTLRLLGDGGPVNLAGLPPGAVSGPNLLTGAGSNALNGPMVPDPVQARHDYPPDGACEVAPAATTSPSCLFGDTGSGHRIVLLGDSHAGQWFSTLLGVAGQRHWGLEELVKQGCPLPKLTVVNPQLGRNYTECDSWRAGVLARLRGEARPDLIVIGSLNRYTADPAALAAGWEQTLAPLRALGAPIVYLKDTPVPGTDIPACLSAHPADTSACAFPRDRALLGDPLADAVTAGREPGVRLADVDQVLCPAGGDTCPAVLDRILLYRDTAHLTNVAAVVLTPRIDALLSAIPATGGSTAPGAWTPLFRDDFTGAAGTRPDPRVWQYDLGSCYPGCPAAQWGTGEQETVTDSTANVRLNGAGALEIVPTLAGGKWSSGRIETRRADLVAPVGGVLRIEASLRLPDVSGAAAGGYWPAFWTLGGGLRNGFTGWPGVGELDVMESVNGQRTVFGTMHCGVAVGGSCREPQGLSSAPQDCAGCAGGFHTYAVEVDRSASPEMVRWYLDGREYHRVTAAGIDPAAWDRAVHHGMFVILDLAVGGTLPSALGSGLTPATQPGHAFRVDYVTAEVRTGAVH